MATGSLLLPLGYAPLHPTTGALVPNGILRFFRTGTTTAQDTYSDSTLLVANSADVTLSAAGRLETKVYGNPSSGYNYRVRLYTSASALLDTWDDVVCTQSDVATIQEGSFTGTLTGYASGPTGTVNYTVISNIGGTGKLVTLYVAANISGTSNATSLTMTGMPAAIRPSATRLTPALIGTDNGANALFGASIATSGTITFLFGTAFSASGFTNSGTKGLIAGWSATYPL